MLEATNIPVSGGGEVVSTAKPQLSSEEREALELDLKKTQEEISDLRLSLSLKLQHESELKHKLGLTLIDNLQNDLKIGIKTITDSNTYHKTVEVLSTAKDKTSYAVHETKDLVTKKLSDAKQSNTYKEVEQTVGNLVNSMKDALFYAAYGPQPISDEEYEEPIGDVKDEKDEKKPATITTDIKKD